MLIGIKSSAKLQLRNVSRLAREKKAKTRLAKYDQLAVGIFSHIRNVSDVISFAIITAELNEFLFRSVLEIPSCGFAASERKSFKVISGFFKMLQVLMQPRYLPRSDDDEKTSKLMRRIFIVKQRRDVVSSYSVIMLEWLSCWDYCDCTRRSATSAATPETKTTENFCSPHIFHRVESASHGDHTKIRRDFSPK